MGRTRRAEDASSAQAGQLFWVWLVCSVGEGFAQPRLIDGKRGEGDGLDGGGGRVGGRGMPRWGEVDRWTQEATGGDEMVGEKAEGSDAARGSSPDGRAGGSWAGGWMRWAGVPT